MRVWRIHIKNDVESGYTRQDLLEFCQKEMLIGVGWGNITTREIVIILCFLLSTFLEVLFNSNPPPRRTFV